MDVHLTDYMCEGVMKAILVNARALMNLDDYNARAEFMWTAIAAHNGLLAAGRNQDWATYDRRTAERAVYAVHGSDPIRVISMLGDVRIQRKPSEIRTVCEPRV